MPRPGHIASALLVLAALAVATTAHGQRVGIWIEGGPIGTANYQNAFDVAMEPGSEVHVGAGLQVGRFVAMARTATLGHESEGIASVFGGGGMHVYDSFEGALLLGYAFPVTDRAQFVPLAGYAARHEERRRYDSVCLFCSREDADDITSRSAYGATVGFDVQVRVVRVLGLTAGVRTSFITADPLVQGHVGLRFGWLR